MGKQMVYICTCHQLAQTHKGVRKNTMMTLAQHERMEIEYERREARFLFDWGGDLMTAVNAICRLPWEAIREEDSRLNIIDAVVYPMFADDDEREWAKGFICSKMAR